MNRIRSDIFFLSLEFVLFGSDQPGSTIYDKKKGITSRYCLTFQGYLLDQRAGGAPMEKAESVIRSSGFIVPLRRGQSLRGRNKHLVSTRSYVTEGKGPLSI